MLRAIIEAGFKGMIARVVIGADENLYKDYSDEIKAICLEYKVAYCTRDDFVNVFYEPEVTIAIAAGWRWIIKSNFAQIIVFHDSLLPKYRGFNPLVSALLNHEPFVGVTAIVANNKFDCGDIVDRRKLNIKYPKRIEDAISEVSRLYFDLAQSIVAIIDKYGIVSAVKQDEAKATYSVWRDEEDYRINWNESAEKIAHFIKCVSYPYKGAATMNNGQLIRILEAEVERSVKIENNDVGKVLFIIEDKPIVICGRGILRIDVAVDDNGKSVLPLRKFRTRFK